MFNCEILAHSINEYDQEVITYKLCYERSIHSEFAVHRAISKNSSSSRAIPIGRMMDWTGKDPAFPLHWGSNKSGMQSGPEIDEYRKVLAKALLDHHLEDVLSLTHSLYHQCGLHKEIVNRYLEPFSYINTIATCGKPGLMNLFKLRMDRSAHPNMQRLVVNMARAYRNSTPKLLKEGEWHLPFVTNYEKYNYGINEQRIWSVARSAWVSYRTVDDKIASFEKAKIRHDDCIKYLHCTPCEHQLTPKLDWDHKDGSVPGYLQYRKMIVGEFCEEFDYENLLDTVYADRDYIAG